MEMISLFTETLEDLLVNQGYGTEYQSQSLTEILNLMEKFPDFYFEIDEYTNITMPMLTMFMDRYDIREIGAESEELFMHFWREKTNELLVKYVPKMTTWLNNFNELFKFTVKLERKDTNSFENSSKNTYYLNPITNSVSGLKVQDVDENEGSSDTTFEQERDVLQSVWGKTRANIMSEILNLKDFFNDCLEEFEEIFMGVL